MQAEEAAAETAALKAALGAAREQLAGARRAAAAAEELQSGQAVTASAHAEQAGRAEAQVRSLEASAAAHAGRVRCGHTKDFQHFIWSPGHVRESLNARPVYVVWAPSEDNLGGTHGVREHAMLDLCMGPWGVGSRCTMDPVRSRSVDWPVRSGCVPAVWRIGVVASIMTRSGCLSHACL